jgi:hypothetical protein
MVCRIAVAASYPTLIATRKRLQPSLRPWLTLTALFCGSCSFLVDTSQKQCSVDADCLARGLQASICVAHICQALASAAGNGATSSGIEASSGTTSDPSLAPPSDVRDGAAGMTSASVNMTSGAAGMSFVTAGMMSATMGTPSAAGTPAAGAAGTLSAGAAGTATMRGPECSVNDDCERRGVSGGMCVDSMCWAPAPQCNSDQDCVARGPEYVGGRCAATQCLPNPKWRCAAPVVSTASGTVELTVPVVDALSLAMVPRVRIVACNKLDLTCAMPAASATTGTDGKLKITVPASFAGYLQQTERTDYAPAMYFLPTTLPVDGILPNFPLLGSGVIIDALAFALGAGLDPKRGHMMLIADDCFGMALSGVNFSSPQADKSTAQFYVRDQLPSTMASDTTNAGNGGYLNFPAGTALITAKDVKSGLELATVSILVRAGFISVSYIRPAAR